jgi:hypothetical protein
MFKKIYKFFDRFEDMNRIKLSHSPIFYAFLTGAGIILFWRGIWHAADEIPFLQDSYVSIVVGATLLLAIGTFISSFIGNEIIISGNKREKKLVDRIVETEEQDLMHEFEDDTRIMHELKDVRSQLDDIRKMLEGK